MFSLRSLPARVARASLYTQCLHLNRPSTNALSILHKTAPSSSIRKAHHTPLIQRSFQRPYSEKSAADSLIEAIQDQYATAKDEFEIATEETEGNTVYAADDRAAARQELDKLKSMYEEALTEPDGEEVKRRVGHRIRELNNAVEALEKKAMEE